MTTSRPCRIKPILAKEIDNILDLCLASSLIQHLTHLRTRAPWPSSLEQTAASTQRSTPQILTASAALNNYPFRIMTDFSTLSGKVLFSPSSTSSFRFTISRFMRTPPPLTLFYPLTQLYKWLAVSQDNIVATGWIVIAFNEEIKGPQRVSDSKLAVSGGPSNGVVISTRPSSACTPTVRV